MSLHDFHLLRPWWLLALVPAVLLFVLHLKHQLRHSRWVEAIDPALLDALLDTRSIAPQRRWPLALLLTGWMLATLALSGPCFEKSNQNALKQADAVVVLLDLSPSMLVKDVAPTRLQAAHYKILDLLRQRKEGYTGLIAYSGSAHVVAPLSDDTNTVAALVTTLEPGIMPNLGSQVEDAVQEAIKLLENSHFTRGRLLLVSDGIEAEALASIHKQLRGKSIELHVIGVGTTQGGPIPTDSGNFVKDETGRIRLFPFSPDLLQQLATENGGQYHNLSSDDSDIATLLAPPAWLSQMGNGSQRDANHTIENWHDAGYWLVLPCLLLALVSFRRGVIACLLPLMFLTATPDSHALDLSGLNLPDLHWQDWWQTPDQQAAAALQKGDNKTAAEKFRNPEWKAYAEYQNQQHAEAAKHFSASDSAAAHYNRGNALAHTLDFNGAIKEYDEALKRNPSLADAETNKQLVKKLLEEQKNQQNQQDKNQKNQQDKNGEQKDQQNQQQDQQQSQDSDKQQQDSQQQASQQQDSQQQDSQQKDNPPGNPQDDSAKNPDEQKSGEPQDVKNQDGKQPDDHKKQDDEQQKAEAQQAAEPTKASDDKQDQQASNQADSKDPAEQEKQDAARQWLRRVPDDPGGLLRNKFDYYYKIQQQQDLRDRRNNPASTGKETRW